MHKKKDEKSCVLVEWREEMTRSNKIGTQVSFEGPDDDDDPEG